MATTSTVPAVKKQIVDKLKTALASASRDEGQVPVTYAWPGPATQPECVFLGPNPQTADLRLDLNSDIPTIKAGRKQRQETYTVRITVWEWRPDLNAVGAETAEDDAFKLAAKIEDVFADDPTIGLSQIQWAKVDTLASTLWPFEKGWGCELAIDIDVAARLT